MVLRTGMRVQAIGWPVVATYFSISWSSVQTATPAPQILAPGLSASNARKMMSAPSGPEAGVIDTPPAA